MGSIKAQNTIRIVSLVAATAASLASGTNYAYSAWEPQLAERLKLSATEGELIGTFGNLGMYITGIPFGILVDQKGPRAAALIGALCLAAGYFPIHQAYDRGMDGMSTSLLCFFSFLTGMGSCSSFQASLKTAALNWPQHRGTATAFPVAAFGLSAFFFSTISSIVFPDNTSGFLLLLAIGTSAIVFGSIFFLHIVPAHSPYTAIPSSDGGRRVDSTELYRTHSTSSSRSTQPVLNEPGKRPSVPHRADTDEDDDIASVASIPDDAVQNMRSKCSRWVDMSGLALLLKQEFWQLWLQMGLLSGIGLMTINNIGNNTQALWRHFDTSVPEATIMNQQSFHVSVLSFMSFTGRLLSGVSSDILVKRLHASRFWCATAAGTIFALAQVAAMNIENPHKLWIVSSLTGLAYGFLFGVMPALVVDSFGGSNLSVNWGFITLAPIVSGNIFNLFYGVIYDHHSTVAAGGERECGDGLACFKKAYILTFFASIAGIAVSWWGVRHQRTVQQRLEKERQDDHRGA
ncbi:MFS transporter [Pseudovirgaria hyperparasitica]|uniref:MFS transporter n=1 Tax=Pseudovirgaria hyperparasitica TaxID=470096 RepID=A0A6A6WJC2_9PEZI|nr:MFS transporter [Pseudovirgaria hyperparasitica]KAF2762334.1 MFS transporter [Pseudovirgaria hyperparasitica]